MLALLRGNLLFDRLSSILASQVVNRETGLFLAFDLGIWKYFFRFHARIWFMYEPKCNLIYIEAEIIFSGFKFTREALL